MRYFIRLPGNLKRVAATTLLMAPQVKRRIHRNGIPATMAWLNKRQQPAVVSPEHAAEIAHIAQSTTARMPGSYNCLTRSLLVWWLVGGDEAATIRFGVNPGDEDGFKFHAWVEVRAVVINDSWDVSEGYLPFEGGPFSVSDFD